MWTTLGAGANDEIFDTAEHGADLVAVGTFTSIGGIAANGVASWNGTTWSALGSGIDPSSEGYPYAAISYGGQVVIGGAFTAAGGSPAQHIARWDGSAFHELGGGADDFVNTLLQFGPDLVVGGLFKHVGGIPAPGAALWNGSSWTPLGDNAEYVYEFREHAGRLYAVGEFIDGDGEEVEGVALWTGERWYPLGSGVDGVASTLEFVGDDLYMGGRFGWANGKPSFNIARLPGASLVGVGDGPRTASLALSVSRNPARGAVELSAAGRS